MFDLVEATTPCLEHVFPRKEASSLGVVAFQFQSLGVDGIPSLDSSVQQWPSGENREMAWQIPLQKMPTDVRNTSFDGIKEMQVQYPQNQSLASLK